jgi:hypothetical protein
MNTISIYTGHDANISLKVGGISYNKSFPADFMYDNLMIQSNIIHSSYVNNV